ncbi:MAG: hypothetical protein IPL31_07510 [Saprospiraceae bacterium]|nr:hypothetical protein [Saprospiraceae bacterium]
MKIYLLQIFVFCTISGTQAQVPITPIDSMRFYADAMFSMRLIEHKLFAEHQFLRLATTLIKSNEDSSKLSFHPSFVIAESADKKLKIVSWQIDENFQNYRYAAFVFADSCKPIFLKSEERNLNRINFESFTEHNWYGALYYHFVPEKINGYYTLFGYRFSKDGNKHRFIDVIKIDHGNIQIGSPIFKHYDTKEQEELYFRHVIHYSPSANVILRYEEDSKMIFFDHIDQITDSKSGEVLMVPDGTFEAFELKDGYWNYIPYQRGEILENAPRERPVLGKDSKDLFGKSKVK